MQELWGMQRRGPSQTQELDGAVAKAVETLLLGQQKSLKLGRELRQEQEQLRRQQQL